MEWARRLFCLASVTTSFQKTIQLQLVTNQFISKVIFSLGIDYRQQEFEIDGKRLKMQLWDTTGQERFRSIAEGYYKNAKGIILVYSVTEQDSFADVEEWLNQIKSKSRKDICLVLVGTKIDKPGRCISSIEGQTLAKKHGIGFLRQVPRQGRIYKKFFVILQERLKRKYSTRSPSQQMMDQSYKRMTNAVNENRCNAKYLNFM